MQPAPIEIQLERDGTLLTLAAVREQFKMSDETLEVLRYRLQCGGIDDPMGSAEKGVVYDNERLQRFIANVANQKPQSKLVRMIANYWRRLLLWWQT